MRNLDLAQCHTPDDLVVTLRAAAEQFAQDAADMDATQFLNGKHWALIAAELDRAADRIVTRCSKRGYQFNTL